jgi:hypothetical protein
LQILENTSYTSIADTGKYWLYQYCSYWKILENIGYTSIADTGRLATKLRNVFLYSLCFFCPVCASVMRGRTVYRETGKRRLGAGERRRGGRKKREGRKVKQGGRNEKRSGRKEKRGGRMDKRTPCPPLCYGTVFLWPTPSFQHRSSKSSI